jgi:histidinol-phosphate aminotransferase
VSVLDLARAHLRGVEPYRSARSLALEAEVFLDANESPRPLREGAQFEGLNRYPAPQPPALVREAARYYGVPAASVVVTRGADEGIDLLVRAFVEPVCEDVLIAPPTYGVYAIAARLHGAAVREAPLDAARGFAFDADAALKAARPGGVKIAFVCRPNNPTGTGVPLAAVERLAAGLAERALVAVDEAYLEFSGGSSAAELIARLPNVVVLKTLSKAWGLAGARVGFLLAAPELAALLQAVRAPYPISAPSARAAEAVFDAAGEALMRRSVAAIVAERARLSERLLRVPGVTRVLPSEANFLIAVFANKAAALDALRSRGIIARDRSAEPGLDGGVRITVGTPEENDRLLAVLEAARV